MSDLNLDAIRKRQERALVFVSHERPNEYDPDHTGRAAYILTVGDVPALVDEVERWRADASRLYLAEQRVSLAQGLAEDWAANKDVVLASAGRALLNVTGGAR